MALLLSSNSFRVGTAAFSTFAIDVFLMIQMI